MNDVEPNYHSSFNEYLQYLTTSFFVPTAGLKHLGCYYVNRFSRALGLLEKLTKDLMDDPTTRTNPIRKCASAAQDYSYSLFALSAGYCISGSNNRLDYQYVRSEACRDGRGAFVSGYFIMDVYEIVNTRTFQDSISPEGAMTTLPVTTSSNTTSASLGSGAAGLYCYSLWVLLIASIIIAFLTNCV